jgi:predicted nucleic acid-binding protein
MKPVLLDTGPIVALIDSSDSFHKVCVESMSSLAVPLVTCESVIAESCYLLRKVAGAAEAILENVASGVFQIPLALPSYARDVQRTIAKYRDREIDLADACLIHLANEFKTGVILTLDADFRVYRWGKNNPFELVVSLN